MEKYVKPLKEGYMRGAPKRNDLPKPIGAPPTPQPKIMEKYNAETLKPCPFCKGDAVKETGHHGSNSGGINNPSDYWEQFGCRKCLIFKPTAKEWNTRHITEPVVSEREVLELLDKQERAIVEAYSMQNWSKLNDVKQALKQKYGVSE